MRALHTALVLETGRTSAPAMFVKARGSVQGRAEAQKATRTMFMNMALFLSAPLIGLLYAIFLPFIGLGMLAWFGVRSAIAPVA